MNDCQELYNRVKQHPDAIVMDVGEPDPFIIHEAHALVTFKDGTQGNRVVYTTFEYAKNHLNKFKGCDCDACQGVVAACRGMGFEEWVGQNTLAYFVGSS